jgi:hypothetical protein
MKLIEDKMITVEGVILVSKDHAGEMHVVEAATIWCAMAPRSSEEWDWWWVVCTPAARSDGRRRRRRRPDRQVCQAPGRKRYREEDGGGLSTKGGILIAIYSISCHIRKAIASR